MDPTLIRHTADKILQQPWAHDLRDQIGQRVRAADRQVSDQAGGWIHDYVCLEHWDVLDWRDGAHWCPQGHTVTGNQVDAAWCMYEHRRLADLAADAAVLAALTGEATDGEIAHMVLRQYAERYAHYHHAAQDWMLKGHVMQQALTEALWGVPIAQAARLLRAQLSTPEWAFLRERLLIPMMTTLRDAQTTLIEERHKPHSNYNAWLIAALAALGDALDDAALLDQCAAQVRQHLELALLSDGMQWEGSPYYHMFVALALVLAAEPLYGRRIDLYAYRTPQGQSLRSMVDRLVELSGPDGHLPQRRDGPYWRGGPFPRELAQLLEIAQFRLDVPEYRALLGLIYRQTPRDSRYALLYGGDTFPPLPTPRSLNLPHSGLAVLRDPSAPLTLTLEYGEHGGEHGHLDKLSLHIQGFSDDPGSPPYAVPERRSYYQHTAAHNTVMVDGQPQQECSGRLLDWTPTRVSASADDAYPGVSFQRTVEIVPGDSVQDHTLLESETVHTYDWLLHGRGTLRVEGTDHPEPISTALSDAVPGALIVLRERLPFQGQVRVSVGGEDEPQTVLVTITVDQPALLLLGEAPGRSFEPQVRRPLLIVRVQARQAAIRCQYQFTTGER